MRIKSIEEELVSSTILASIGAFLFLISDSIFLVNLYYTMVPYSDVININLYWMGLVLMAGSLVRSKTESYEKDGVFRYDTDINIFN